MARIVIVDSVPSESVLAGGGGEGAAAAGVGAGGDGVLRDVNFMRKDRVLDGSRLILVVDDGVEMAGSTVCCFCSDCCCFRLDLLLLFDLLLLLPLLLLPWLLLNVLVLLLLQLLPLSC